MSQRMGRDVPSRRKERTLPADYLFPVLVYDAHGRQKRHCIEQLEARGWKWRRVVPGKWMRSDLRFAARVKNFNCDENGKEMPSGGSEKRGDGNEICELPFPVGCPKGRVGMCLAGERKRALSADCLLPVLFYDAHGRRSCYCIQ
ncbi:hypothetical protein CEXT_108831 [Caerostris extrusa]|uniref:Uncharacterized protein n=1 Tax=Caerostris extrusa TaxID=172846 RepID=A0AAV4R774_CAEEX|nr:hypothetical protein CEXT_108831 [Caerostris extrusa]